MNAIQLIPLVLCVFTWAFSDTSYFPVQKSLGEEGVSAFEANWYGKSLQRMAEPRLPDLAKDSTMEVYRLMILPTWGNSVVVRVSRHGDTYTLSARRLDGQAGYDPGKLVEKKEVELSAEDSAKLRSLIQNIAFFQMPIHDDVQGEDGDETVFEGVMSGKYHVITRWCASEPAYHPDKRGLRHFLDLSKFLLDKAALSEKPRNKGHKLI